MLDRPVAPEGEAPQRQPMFDIPGAILTILVLLVAIHVARQFLPDAWDDALFTHLAFVPGRLSFSFVPDRVVGAMVALAGQGAEGYRQAQAERFFLGTGSAEPWTTVTYALLHADWAHVGLNAVWLLAFGTPVARRFGTRRFFAFLVVTAWAGAMVHWAAHALDLAPVIGASAAVSGCMGATLRFMFKPQLPPTAMADAAGEGRHQAVFEPTQPLRAMLQSRRAVAFMVAWFLTNLLFGLGSLPSGLASGPIAWEAHIGGFLAGLLLFRLFDPRREAGSVDVSPAAPLDPAAPQGPAPSE